MADEQSTNGGTRNVGTVIEIQGVVIDAVFTDGLPEIYTALKSSSPSAGTRATELVAEVRAAPRATTACAPSRWTPPTVSPAAST